MTVRRASTNTDALVSPRSTPNRATNDASQIQVAGLAERAARVNQGVEVLEILNSFDGVDQEALRLIYWEGLTQKEAARQLAVPESNVRRSVARGMRQLAERLTTGTT